MKKFKCNCGRIFEKRIHVREHSMLLAPYHKLMHPDHFLIDDNSILTAKAWEKTANKNE